MTVARRALLLLVTAILLTSHVHAQALSVRSFGAVGDGVTNDTAALQAALNATADIYVPRGTYLTCGLSVTRDLTRIHGDGDGSRLLLMAGCGTLLDAGPYVIDIDRVRLSGGDIGSQADIAVNGARTGLMLSSQVASRLDHITVDNFDKFGIVANDPATNRLSHLTVTSSVIANCWDALVLEGNFAEYVRLSDLDIHGNRYGLDLEAGNIIASGLKVNDNGYGVFLFGSRSSNNGHGSIVGSMINHSSVYAIFATDITIGFVFSGNQIHDGPIYLQRSTGIQIANGEIDTQGYYFEGGGANRIHHNFFFGALANIVTHNYLGSADATVFADNFP